MRREYELRQIVSMADTADEVAGDDKESNLKKFIDGMGISPQDKEQLWNLYGEAANQAGDFGITEGIKYSIGDDSEYTEDFINRLQTGRTDVGGLERDNT